MSERHPDGFLRHRREPIGYREPAVRKRDYEEIYRPTWKEPQLQAQGQRCMDCGVPTCMAGCPIGNLIPEWNDLVYRDDWKEALGRLHATNNFPEFTGYTCPAPCEPSCVLAWNDEPVTIKNIERAIVDKGWQEGWIVPDPPRRRTGFKVAIVGSGPAGLSAAQQLNRAGHSVTVFERDDALGGLMTYGIPDFKFSKYQVERRIRQLSEEGIAFRSGIEVGRDVTMEELQRSFDAVCLAIGALAQRDVELPGRHLGGVLFAMDFLVMENRRQAGRPVDSMVAATGKNVVVLGGGDTGADCVATAHRQCAAQVTQISVRARPPSSRPSDNPWPEEPQVYEKTYALQEGGIAEFGLDTGAFVDENGDGHVEALIVDRVDWTLDEHGRRVDKTILERNRRIPADLVLLAIGFSGPQAEPLRRSGLALRHDGTIKVGETMMTSLPGVFAAGDANMGASIVVWAIGEGRDVARCIDCYLTGDSKLPRSLRTPNPPIETPRWKLRGTKSRSR